jgi:hypothetical protein
MPPVTEPNCVCSRPLARTSHRPWARWGLRTRGWQHSVRWPIGARLEQLEAIFLAVLLIDDRTKRRLGGREWAGDDAQLGRTPGQTVGGRGALPAYSLPKGRRQGPIHRNVSPFSIKATTQAHETCVSRMRTSVKFECHGEHFGYGCATSGYPRPH